MQITHHAIDVIRCREHIAKAPDPKTAPKGPWDLILGTSGQKWRVTQTPIFLPGHGEVKWSNQEGETIFVPMGPYFVPAGEEGGVGTILERAFALVALLQPAPRRLHIATGFPKEPVEGSDGEVRYWIGFAIMP